MWLSPHDLASKALVPAVYGGDGMIKSVAAASCGVAASATALARFIRRHAVWGNGGRMVGGRSGSTPGASTYAVSRADGVDWAFTINTRTWPASAPSTVVDDLAGVIDHLLDSTPIADTALDPRLPIGSVIGDPPKVIRTPAKKARATRKPVAAKKKAVR